MSVKYINELHKGLRELFSTSPSYANPIVSFSVVSGEVLTIQLDANIIIQYLKGIMPNPTPRAYVFWRYGEDAFVDATASLPDCVWIDVLDEITRLRGGDYVDTEIIMEVLE